MKIDHWKPVIVPSVPGYAELTVDEAALMAGSRKDYVVLS
jgi:hypothetical protein